MAGPAAQIVMDQQWSQAGMGHGDGAGMMKPRGYRAVVKPDQKASTEKLLKLPLVEFHQYLRDGRGS